MRILTKRCALLLLLLLLPVLCICVHLVLLQVTNQSRSSQIPSNIYKMLVMTLTQDHEQVNMNNQSETQWPLGHNHNVTLKPTSNSLYTDVVAMATNTTQASSIVRPGVIPTAETACRLNFASSSENAKIVELAKTWMQGDKSVDVARFNTRDVLHSYWNVPATLDDLYTTASSPVQFEQPNVGGYWSPSSCLPTCSHKLNSDEASACGVTILVPYRNRGDNFAVFVKWMHSFLQAQQREYRIVLIEQLDSLSFNRAKLFNVGITELRKRNIAPNLCFALHDIDKIPEDTRHVYECAQMPRHMMFMHRKADDPERKYTPGKHYTGYVGGVMMLKYEHWAKINGFSNRYFGWGREDDDFNTRLALNRLTVQYTLADEGRYLVLPHANDRKENTMPWPSQQLVRQHIADDGANSLQYSANVTFEPLFTRISAFL